MTSARLSGLMVALRRLATDYSLASHERTLAVERAIDEYLVKDPMTRKQMLDELNHEVAAETGEFWVTVRDVITQRR